jgi:cytochrome bd-type quinol oxidase subunit 1
MNYPLWDPPMLGGGMIIGIIAIFHVFVSHFAVGGGLYLVLTERKAYREKSADLLEYVRLHSRFFVLVVLVFGAVSGVGIWWSIGLVNPEATATLIHVFVWGWAIEWVFFLVEIAAAFFYYYGWDRLDRKTHLAIGWIYFGTAWASLLVINGILTFMLTPGRWLESQSFWHAWLNPGALPSLVVRSAVCVSLAGVYGLMTAAALRDLSLRMTVVRYAAGWVLAGSVVIPFAGLAYIATLPDLAREISMGAAPAVTIFAGLSIFFSALVVLFTFLGPWLSPRHFNLAFALVIAVLAFCVTGVTEWVREAVRKPYIIYDYMYSNTVRVKEMPAVRQVGVLPSARFVRHRSVTPENRLEAGEELFRVQCQSCHTVDGYNSMRFAVKGWPEDMIEYQLLRLDQLKGFMPPFMGNDAERKALAAWLARLNPQPEQREPAWRSDLPGPPAQPVAAAPPEGKGGRQ